MQTKMMRMMSGAALCGALWMSGASADPATDMTQKDKTSEPAAAKTGRHWPQPHQGAMSPGSDERADMVSVNATALVNTLSEEKTEIATLAAQIAEFRKMGGAENMRIAALLERMRREHVAAGPALMKLTRRYGGNPNMAKPMKAPVLGDKATMLHATHMDHMAAVQSSQVRWKMTNSWPIKTAMRKRSNLARKHMRWMKPYHDRAMAAKM